MTSAAKKILKDALALPQEEREALVDALCETFEDGVELSAAWVGEIERRIESVRDGRATFVDAHEHLAELRRTLAS